LLSLVEEGEGEFLLLLVLLLLFLPMAALNIIERRHASKGMMMNIDGD
jgi:hypothetical protein